MGEREYKCGPLSYRRMNPYGSVVKSHNGLRNSQSKPISSRA